MAPALQPDKPKLPKPTVGFVQARKLQLSTKPFSSPPTRDELEKTQKWAPNANLASTFPPNGSIPWERFATSDKPLVFNSTSYTARAGTYSFLWGCGYDCYSHRTQCCYPVAQCLIRSGAGGAEWASVKEAGFEAMFEKVLKTGASPDTPPSLLGLWYMRGNIAPPETLFTVHDAEWVKTAEGGYIGLKHQSYNWSADATCWGWLWMRFRPTAPFRFEVSPDGNGCKWVNVAGSQQWAYLLQPGDRVTNAQESDAILASWVEESKAGDWMRYSYDDQAQLKGAGGYMYAWEKIAFLDDDGKLKLTPAYQSFLADVERAKARRAPCGTGCCWSGMQATEALTELSEVQGWQIAPPAPIATMER